MDLKHIIRSQTKHISNVESKRKIYPTVFQNIYEWFVKYHIEQNWGLKTFQSGAEK